MSFKISKMLHFPQPTLQYIIPQTECDISLSRGLPLLGGVLSDTRNVWHAKGPCLEVRNTKTGTKVGAWTFGSILKDSNTKVVCVEEIQRLNGRLSLLAVGIDCTISGGLICIFDVFGSKVIRAIQIKEKITGLHVVDSGCEVLNLPGPLRNFDGIIAVGTEGGNVFLVDICRQICEEALYTATVRDELYPCQLILLTLKDISKIEYYKEQSVREGDHLAIHLNVVFHSRTEHFTLKGPKGEDRIHVNREEVVTSALYYCSQLTSLLIGFNFGAFQLWDLTSLNLVYTSPVCEEHLPITHFALQEPADDPRAFCYIWVSYSNSELYQTGLPFAVMYSVSYDSKEFHEGYGYLYQDFHSCSVRFQVELGQLEYKSGSKSRGGCCIGLQPVYKVPANKELYAHDNTGDTLALCAISWTVWFNQNETQSYLLVFDLNQWYKEQMPHFTKGSDCSNYILRVGISDLITMAGQRGGPLLDIKIDKKTLRQFSGVQRLEEHFCPTALSFDLWTLGESSIVLLHNEGVQQALLNQIEGAGPLCLIRPSDIYRQIITLGLSPLFIDISMSIPVSTDIQREIILNVGLEHQLVGWLSRCAMEWANGSFSSAGCSLDFLLYWGFQRAILLKNNCDKYCMPLFDYSQSRLDNNTSILLNSCTRQINNVCILYSYVINKLSCFVSNLELITEQYSNLKMVSMYFEVLQWLVNVGLLPECHPSTYPRPDNTERISAPYPVQELTGYYNEKRAQLQLLSKETFVSSDSLLFIDNLINNKCGAEQLQKHWQEDGGSGLYPPPSLQSMLRTYLVEGTDISHKHSLVIYVFLDLAMALDQSRYASVITHLIKFPAVFKVSSSIIKITQAFWQLDHGDYTTAMEQLLDPFVLSDDLQPWHHAIAMRALLLQNQYNFALLYMQVRRPPITDEKDMLTAISLFISNNMLDEAFYFKNQHHSGNEEKLLMHLFNECNKNESLHVLLYKCLTSNEEKAFFKYLKSVENPSLGDLQVFYYLMRSRFVEAFDAHQNSRRKKPECQGLIGQRNATRTDQIVRIFKTLLPDVNRNLVDVIQRERANLWKEVARPTPLSVFVHNTNEQIKYKSTVIQAALAKAKHTFNDSMNNSKFREVVTEETPFVRTPKAYRTISRHVTPVITPKVIEINEFGEEISPSPCKKMKLTPRTSTTSPIWNRNVSINSTMLTPIVKRNASLRKDESLSTSNINVCTPQSILKIRNLVRHSDTMPDDSNVSDMLEDNDVVARLENSSRKSGLGLLPRKSLSRTSHRPHVQFDDAARYSSLFSEQSVKSSRNNTTPENQSLEKSTLSSKDISFMVSSKNSSTSNTSNTDDIFYSPNASINELSKSEEENSGTDRQNRLQNEGGAAEIIADKGEMIIPQHASYVSQSPKARRSYKRSLGDSLPIRTSSRLPRTSSMQSEKSDLESAEKLQIAASREKSVSTDVELPQAHTSTQYQSPRLLQKVKGRKSLNKQVLETDTLSRRKSTSLPSDKPVSKEISLFKTEKTVITEKTSISSEVTTIETKMDLSTTSTQNSDGSHSLTSSSSIFNKKVHELTVDNDTSLELNVSLGNPELPENLKMSNSLVEYMKSRACKYDDSKPESSKTQIASEPMEVYEDLSSGAEDIEEVLTASRQQMDNSKLCGESIKNREDISDELERSNLQRRERSLAEPKDETTQGSFNISRTTISDSTILNEQSISSTAESPLLGECTKLLQKGKGRKSLSRQVLEHNTLSRMMATTPLSDDIISKEVSVIEASHKTSKSKTLDSDHDLTSSSVFERSMDVDTSVESTIIDSPILPDRLKMSSSLVDYMKSRFTKRDNVDEILGESNRSQSEKSEIQPHDSPKSVNDALSVPVFKMEKSLNISKSKTLSSDHDFTSSSVFEGNLDMDSSVDSNIIDSPELPDRLKMSDSLMEYVKSGFTKRNTVDEIVSESNRTQTEGSEIVQVRSQDSQKHAVAISDEVIYQSQSMEVYEDLSSGAEDIEEVLAASKQIVDNPKTYAELSNCSENAYDELEKNIFEVTQSREHSFEENITQENLPNISGITSHSSDSFYVPEAEKAFIISPSKLETSVINANSYLSEAELPDIQTDSLSKQPAEVIEIGSSTDEEDSSKREHSDTTSDSRSSEKSDSDIDDLNISYERNIHVEENSRSLIDSEFSATSVGHLNEPNMDEDNHADEIGNIIEDPGVESNNESELEINEDNSTLDQKSNKENEQPLVPEEEESAALKSVHKPEDESRNIIELEHIKEMTMDDNTTEVEISEASIEQRTLKAGDETTEIKITSDISKETSLLHLNEDKAQEKGKNNDKTMNYHSDSKISLHVEIPVEKNEESQKERIIEVIQKQIFKNTKKDSTDKLEENCSKVESSTLSDKSDAKSTKEEMDEIAEHIGQSEQLQKETKEQQTNTSSTLLKDNTTSIYTEKVGKKNQSTNTTIISDKADPELKLLTVRVEQSTSSTGFMSEKNKAVENNDTVLETNKPKDRRVYHPKYGTMKVTSEDQTISSVSSDTTEGESLSQAIVVTAQVHTPSRKRSETPLIKRLTRRNSNLFSQAAESDVLDNVLSEPDISMDVTQFDIMDDDCPNKTHQTPLIKAYVTDILDNSNLEADDSTVTITPGRRNRRSQSSSTTPTRSIKARRLSATEKIEEPLDSNLSVFKRELTVPLKRTRSVSSVDSTQLSRRLLRSNSVEKNIEECDHNKPKTKRKSASVSNLPIISEDNKEQSKIGDRSKSNSTVEAYATTRRLTRRQASLVKGIQTPSSVTAQDDSEMDKSLEVDIIDPIILLDKEPFQGKPDPEEEKVYEQSSPSNSTTSSFSKPTKRVSRSASVASDSSIPPSASQPSTPKRRTRRPVEHMDSPSSGVKTRLRKHSETSSIASEKSDPPTPKRVRKRDTSKEPDENNSDVSVALSTRSTRSRANSTSSIKSDTLNSPKRATRSRRLVSAKSDLPEITEEKS